MCSKITLLSVEQFHQEKGTTRVKRVHGATQIQGLECSLLTIAHLSSGLGSISSRLLNNLCHLICNRQSLELKQQHEWLRTRRFDGLIYPSLENVPFPRQETCAICSLSNISIQLQLTHSAAAKQSALLSLLRSRLQISKEGFLSAHYCGLNTQGERS